MRRFARGTVAAVTLLALTMTSAPYVRAAGDGDLSGLVGTDVAGTANRNGTDDLWDIIGTQVVEGGRNTVEFKEYGIALSVTPSVDDRDGVDLVFIIVDQGFFVNVGTNRQPRWERVSEQEFWALVAHLEARGFGFVADSIDEALYLQLVFL